MGRANTERSDNAWVLHKSVSLPFYNFVARNTHIKRVRIYRAIICFYGSVMVELFKFAVCRCHRTCWKNNTLNKARNLWINKSCIETWMLMRRWLGVWPAFWTKVLTEKLTLINHIPCFKTASTYVIFQTNQFFWSVVMSSELTTSFSPWRKYIPFWRQWLSI